MSSKANGVRRFAIGDPQAPFAVFLEILDRRGLLAEDGRLAADVSLVSIGDHFDYGSGAERRAAQDDGLALLSWLAEHPPEQVVIIAGNHDLGRLGELADFDDATFDVVHAEAVAIYRDGQTDENQERELLERFPALPTAELAARDFAAFSEAQRALVRDLLRERRLRLAHAEGDMLFCHAGTTIDYLDALDIPREADAASVADGLNRALDAAFDAWTSGPLIVPHVHRPGDAAYGEGVGMLYHRPTNPAAHDYPGHALTPTMARRYDVRRIPRGITQVIGHINDGKCRELLGPWADDAEPRCGVLRHLVTDGERVSYQHGPLRDRRPEEAAMIFLDGAMSRIAPTEYELLRY